MWALVPVVSDHSWRPRSHPQPPPWCPVQKFLFCISLVFPYLFLCSCVSFSGRHYTAGCCTRVPQKPALSSSDMPNTHTDSSGSGCKEWQSRVLEIESVALESQIKIYCRLFLCLFGKCNESAKITAAFCGFGFDLKP